jgi:NADPH:quinone reductase-like Zn-dependent oxidoreductase
MIGMKAAIYHRHGGPEEVQITTLPRPAPGPGQVLVRLAAAGVSPLDWKLRAGLLRVHFPLTFPKIPGRDGAGNVLEVGVGVTGFSLGDRVAVMAPPMAQAGTHAEAIVCDASLVVPVPSALSLPEAAALVNAGLSALIAVERTARVKAGQRIFVVSGAGAVGGLMVQLCAARGAIVTALCHSRNAAYVCGLGADRAIAYDVAFPTDLPPQDVVFDLMGGATHEACYRLLRPGGHLVWLTAAPITDHSAAFGVRATRALIADDAAVVADVLDLAARGELVPQIADTLPLDAAAEAQQRLQAGEVSRGRLLLLV